jgi:S1-C subfamily serine protease
MTARRLMPALLAALVLGAGAGLVACDDSGGGGAGVGARGDGATAAATTRVEVVEKLPGDGVSFNPQAIYEREGAGVVTVYAVFGGGGLSSALGPDNGGGSGVGSGFVVSGKGEIATNAHVVTQGEGDTIDEAREVYVEFTDGNQVPAEIVGHDPFADIALLRVKTEGLTMRPLPLGSSAGIDVGEPVAAIGSPFGERNSLSVGVVSAIERSIGSLTDFQISGAIQTDAAINPGNSGGPLVDAHGSVIGVNQQIRTNSGGGEGVGFAVPVDIVKRSIAQLRAKGKVDYAYLGLSTVAIYPQLADRFDLPVDKGVWVQTVNPGGPAAQAGIRPGGSPQVFQARPIRPGGDVITEVDGRPVVDSDDLADSIVDREPGERVKIRLYRGGEARTVEVTLGARPLDNSTSLP